MRILVSNNLWKQLKVQNNYLEFGRVEEFNAFTSNFAFSVFPTKPFIDYIHNIMIFGHKLFSQVDYRFVRLAFCEGYVG